MSSLRLVFDHLHALAGDHHVADVVERDVTALRGVVQAPVRIFLDQAFFAHARLVQNFWDNARALKKVGRKGRRRVTLTTAIWQCNIAEPRAAATEPDDERGRSRATGSRAGSRSSASSCEKLTSQAAANGVAVDPALSDLGLQMARRRAGLPARLGAVRARAGIAGSVRNVP